jgi:hypothetical protein
VQECAKENVSLFASQEKQQRNREGSYVWTSSQCHVPYMHYRHLPVSHVFHFSVPFNVN